jgi:hypothetical protein
VEKLSLDDGRLLRLALGNIRKWETDKTCHHGYARRWRELLSLSTGQMSDVVLADTDEAAALRQNHPFAGFFSPAERHVLRQVPDE